MNCTSIILHNHNHVIVMDNSIINITNVYLNTLSRMGYISDNEINSLLLTMYLNKYINITNASNEKIKEINRLIECIIKRSCLIKYI